MLQRADYLGNPARVKIPSALDYLTIWVKVVKHSDPATYQRDQRAAVLFDRYFLVQ